MFYWLSKIIVDLGGPSLFAYLSSRSIFAFIGAFVITLLVGRPLINLLYRRGYRSIERSYGDINTATKAGTPVAGGLLIMIVGLGSAILWCDLSNPFVIILIIAGIYFGALGFIDDRLKVKNRDNDAGMPRSAKYLGQIAFGLILGLVVSMPLLTPFPPEIATELHVPFYKKALLDLGWLHVLFVTVVIVYSANAVNFADGLDGLAIVPSFFTLGVLGVFAYVLGNTVYSNFLLYDYLPRAGEVVVFCSALGGAMIGFLWFNCHPAEVFMGDTGSLMIGGIMGTMAVLLKQEAVFFIAGGIFFAEILSTAVQEWLGLGLLKRRIFHRAPIHHTYQHRGMVESKIVVRFWIISAILAAFALSTLKIR
jgi:phospho-N-acetylmuramoyl-pentapeptide-transferase